ncbi:MAG: hypothetical protein HRT52_16790 [Colwellia sp.]|nr:hypothetical protein [Colwellia sp.]
MRTKKPLAKELLHLIFTNFIIRDVKGRKYHIADPFSNEKPTSKQSAKIRKKTLALAYLAAFEPMKISPALDNRIVLNFIRNL